MKKLILCFIMACVAIFSSCQSCSSKVEEPEVITINNYNQIIKDDYKSIKDTFDKVVFYESQVTFDTIVNVENIGIRQAVNVFQAGEYCYRFIHVGNKTDIDKVHDYWLEDVVINPNIIIDLDSAIVRLFQADIVKPKSNKMTLRCPLGPVIYNPAYYFGQGSTGFVKVDAITSKVEDVK